MNEDDRETSKRRSGEEGQGGAAPDGKTPQGEDMPAAGPHARPELTDKDKTPGTGILPEPGDSNPSPTG
ncbi:hypothetical protein ACQR16_02700 [Bradyrhizobium oligotrophicum]|uniref:hypothetical protein n=1 Tax=Bradyrhizobium oligotrophicum TaxID=44255 RepID=UPI003EB8B34F